MCRGCVVDGYIRERCPEDYGVSKGPRGNVKLERSDGLECVFLALLTPGSVDGGYCRVDDVDVEHLRGRRQDDRETAGAGGEVCADLTGRLPTAYNGSEYLLVALRRETRFGFVKALTNQGSETIKDAMIDVQLLLRVVWRFHSDEAREFMGASEREQSYRRECWCSKPWYSMSLALSECTCVCLRPDAAEHADEIDKHSKRTVPRQNDVVVPVFLEGRAFSRQAECDLLLRERERERDQVRGFPGVVWRLR